MREKRLRDQITAEVRRVVGSMSWVLEAGGREGSDVYGLLFCVDGAAECDWEEGRGLLCLVKSGVWFAGGDGDHIPVDVVGHSRPC
jgi:hypothetical protein